MRKTSKGLLRYRDRDCDLISNPKNWNPYVLCSLKDWVHAGRPGTLPLFGVQASTYAKKALLNFDLEASQYQD